MCYKKPGPRCSGHARVALEKARVHTQEMFRSNASFPELLDAVDAEKAALRQYDMTPEGMSVLEGNIASGGDTSGALRERLLLGRTLRQMALDQLKLEDEGDIPHAGEDSPYLKENLVAHNARMEEWDAQSKALADKHAPAFWLTTPGEWHKRKTVVFDLETTGVDPQEARIVTASMLEVYGDPNNPDNIVTREWTVDPKVEIPENAASVHGVDNAAASRRGIDTKTAVSQINALLKEANTSGTPVIAFNASYDLTVLDRESRRQGVTPTPSEEYHVIDPLVIDKKHDKYRKGKRNLESMAGTYGLNSFDAHNSSADCLATAQIAKRLAEKFPTLQTSLPELSQAQQEWKTEWAEGFRAYLTSKGKDASDVQADLGVIPFQKK